MEKLFNMCVCLRARESFVYGCLCATTIFAAVHIVAASDDAFHCFYAAVFTFFQCQKYFTRIA